MEKTLNYLTKYHVIIELALVTLIAYFTNSLMREIFILTKGASILCTLIIVALIILTHHKIIPLVEKNYKKIYCRVNKKLTRIEEKIIVENQVEYCHKNIKVTKLKDSSIEHIDYIIKRRESQLIDSFISHDIEIKEEHTSQYLLRAIQQRIYYMNKLRSEDVRYQLVIPVGYKFTENRI
ncbi:MAG: hypothetical protein ACERKN_19395 [Velocimicrobium sp.]